MRKLTVTLILAAGFLLSGCLTLATHPFYTDDDVVYVPEVDGVWSNLEDGGRWTFVPDDDSLTYVIFTAEEDKPDGEFEGHLFRLDGTLYMDLFPAEPSQVSEFQLAHMLPTHSVWRLTLEEGKLTLDYIDAEAFKKGIRDKTFAIDHYYQDDFVVLTADTPQLQKFLKQQMASLISEDPFVLGRGE